MSNLLSELDAVVVLRDAAEYAAVALSSEEFNEADKSYSDASANFVAAHHAEIAADAKDAARLDWLDANGFTAYRSIDPIDGLEPHCVVVRETMKPRRGNVAGTIREALDAAMSAREGE